MTTAAVDQSKRTKPAARPYRSYEEYLTLPNDGRLVEWVDGEIIEHLPATTTHQNIVIFLVSLMRAFVERLALGRVLAAPLEVKLWPEGPSREPDVLFVAQNGPARIDDKRVMGAPDLIIEVVSPGSVTLDRITRFGEYERPASGSTGSSIRGRTSSRPTSTSATRWGALCPRRWMTMAFIAAWLSPASVCGRTGST